MKSINYFLLCTALISTPSFACKCKQLGIQKNYKNSSMVVYATVQDFIPSPSNEGGTAIISIDEWWKSASPKRIVVNSLTSCSFNFSKEKKYLLFLNEESTGLFYTDNCSGNRELKSANEYNVELEKLK